MLLCTLCLGTLWFVRGSLGLLMRPMDPHSEDRLLASRFGSVKPRSKAGSRLRALRAIVSVMSGTRLSGPGCLLGGCFRAPFAEL